jgi:SPP1 gp7 family putative phage head morphogenesis protein
MPKRVTNRLLFAKRKGEWVKQFKPEVLRGSVLSPSAKAQEWFTDQLVKLTESMTRDVQRDVLALFQSPAAQVLDEDDLYERIAAEERERKPRSIKKTTGSIVSQSRIHLNRLWMKWQKLFDEKASALAKKMVAKMIRSSEEMLRGSLKKATGTAIPTDALRSPALREIVKGSVEEAAGLIRRIPTDYLNKMRNTVMRSITQGAGAPNLFEQLEQEADKHAITTKNWAYNTARDQINKVYSNINRDRMKAAGIKKFEWIHSGGGSHPRPLHVAMSGNIYDMDDPPVIQKANGNTPEIKGLPGYLPNCRCKARPIIDFDAMGKE